MKYEVWVSWTDGVRIGATTEIDLPDDASPEQIEAACEEARQELVARAIESGWRALTAYQPRPVWLADTGQPYPPKEQRVYGERYATEGRSNG